MLSLIGSLLGFGTSFLPSVLGYFKEKRDQAHELKMIAAQTEANTKLEMVRIEGVRVDADIREVEVIHKEQAKMLSHASQLWVNFNSSVRPVLTYLIFIEWSLLTVAVFMGWITIEQFQQIWDEPVQALWATIASFWFGSRSFNRKDHT